MNKHEEILSKYVESPLWQNVVGSEIVTKENALKAMQEVSREQPLREAMENLIYTAEKLWDEVKPIKDTDTMKVTHPIIEAARTALEGDGCVPVEGNFYTDEELEEVKKGEFNRGFKAGTNAADLWEAKRNE